MAAGSITATGVNYPGGVNLKTVGVNLGGGVSLPGGANTPKASNPLLVAANRGIQNNNFRTASAANLLCGETRMQMKTGGAALSEIRLVYSNWYQLPNNGTETNSGNDYTLQASIEWVGIGTRQVTFSGSTEAVNVPDGTAALVSDALFPSAFGLTSFPANTQFWVRSRRIVASTGMKHPKHGASGASGENTFYCDGTANSQLLGTGVMSQQSGGATAQAELGPQAILGRAVTGTPPDIAVCVIGDSIDDGNNDSNIAGDGSAGGGFTVRALWSVNSRTVPWIKQTTGGSTVQNFVAGYTKRAVYYQWCTHMVTDYGTNDMASASRTAAQTLSDLRALWAGVKSASGSRIRHVEQTLIIPRVTSTDSFVTTANQTPLTGFEAGGIKRDALNTSIIANVGSNGLDNYYDPNGTFADPTLKDRWVVTGATNYATTDGTHPQPALHALAAPGLTARVATWN